MPSFYKSLALFKLSGNEDWNKRHKKSIDDAIKTYCTFLKYKDAEHYIKAHYFEIAELKNFLVKLEKKYTKLGYKNDARQIKHFLKNELKQIKGKPVYQEPIESENVNDQANNQSNSNSLRDKIVAYAKTFIGVKYVWAGSDPSGFDCSGYTSYVLKKFNISLKRTASGQMQGSTKIKIANAFKGDLVFFGHSGNITHVGLITSEKGAPLSMIHASSSKGIMLTNIETSSYWKPKMKGVGKVI